MFQLNIKNQNLVKDFTSKDSLLNFLERENIKCQSEDLEAICSVTHADKNGEVLETISFDLPLFSGQKVDDLLLKFGQIKRKHSPVKVNLKRPSLPVEKQKTSSEEVLLSKKKSNDANSNRKKKPLVQLLLVGLTVLSVLLAGSSFMTSQMQAKKLVEIQQELQKNPKSTHQIQGESDVFCRYFLPNYFSGSDSQLKDFIASDKSIEAKEGQTQSVLLERTKYKGTNQVLTYVIALKEKEELKTKRLTITIKKVPSSHYGFEVIKQPTETPFP